jgi:hypothetical protein
MDADLGRAAGAHARGADRGAAHRDGARGENGVTSVQDLPGNARDLEAWEGLRDHGGLTVRVNYRSGAREWQTARDKRTAMKNDEWLRVGGVKAYADGSLGSCTALFFDPVRRRPGNRGVFAAEAIPLAGCEETRRRGGRGRAAGRDPRDRRSGQRGDPRTFSRGSPKRKGPRDSAFPH